MFFLACVIRWNFFPIEYLRIGAVGYCFSYLATWKFWRTARLVFSSSIANYLLPWKWEVFLVVILRKWSPWRLLLDWVQLVPLQLLAIGSIWYTSAKINFEFLSESVGYVCRDLKLVQKKDLLKLSYFFDSKLNFATVAWIFAFAYYISLFEQKFEANTSTKCRSDFCKKKTQF